MNLTRLIELCKGIVVTRDDPRFLELLHGNLWNRLIPDRAPEVLVRAADEEDVVEAVRFARANGLKVTVRGGGHNWCQPTLRNSGMLIDISALNLVLSLDVENRRAVVQPIISNRDSQRALNPHGLAFPSGHCPEVKLSGYLLGGGMAWNHGVWGPGAGSVEAIELVTAQGERITASATENTDYFWAARGAGSGFFGIALRYHLKLHPLPRAIHGSSYSFRLEDTPTVAGWLHELAPTLSPAVELSLFLLETPSGLRDASGSDKYCLVTATAFADTEAEAKELLRPLESPPIAAIARTFAEPTTFENLFDASGALWPSDLRCRVEATFSNAPLTDLVAATASHFEASPSPVTLVLFVIFTGRDVPIGLPDAAYSMGGRYYGGPWTQWTEATQDASNIAWHDECVRRLRPLLCGYYVGESDTLNTPSDAEQAFSPESWKRIAELRAKHDPDGVFFNYSDGTQR